MQEVKILIGSMDRENSVESMNLYDYLEAHNIRNVGNDESDGNYTTNLEGTELITLNQPMGQNRGVGGARFETVSKAYFVRYNSMGYHQIVEFDFDLLQETVIFENMTDSGDIDIMNLSANSYFTDIRLMHEQFLILNNSVNSVWCLNVEDFKNKRSEGFVFEADDLQLLKSQPLIPPVFEYVSDQNRTANSLKGDLFQFRAQYKYGDFRDSSWGTVSKRTVPINEPANGQGQNVSLYNTLKVSVNIGSDRVEQVAIAVRTANDTWLLVKEIEREYILSLPQTTIITDGTTQNTWNGINVEAYDPVTNEYSFLFYNDGLYPILDPVEVNSQYDYIPHTAETVEIINGNLLALGGVTEGYERPIMDEVSITTSEYAPNITSTITGGSDFDLNYTNDQNTMRRIRYYFKGAPKEGDVLYMKYRLNNQVIWQEMGYTVTQTNEIAGLTATLTSAFATFPLGFSVNGIYAESPFVTRDGVYVVELYVVRKNIGTLSTQSINTLKTNSSYQLALAHFDKYGRMFPIVTDDRFIVKTQSLAYTQGNLTQINWQIQSQAPPDAVSYQWLMSENQTHEKSIYLTGNYDTVESSENYIAFELKSLERFYSNENESQVNYSFTKGDKVTMLYTTTGLNTNVTKWFRYPFIELDIVSFEIKEDPENVGSTKYVLKVRTTDLLKQSGSLSYLETAEVMMELYTPKKRAIDSESLLFYEIGEQYDIIDGEYTQTSGIIREGDWYFKLLNTH